MSSRPDADRGPPRVALVEIRAPGVTARLGVENDALRAPATAARACESARDVPGRPRLRGLERGRAAPRVDVAVPVEDPAAWRVLFGAGPGDDRVGHVTSWPHRGSAYRWRSSKRVNSAGVVERVALDKKPVAGCRQHQPACDVSGPLRAPENLARAAKRMDAPEAVEGVAHDCVAGAAAAEHERPCDPLARPGGVAHRRRGVSEWMDATVGIQQVAGRDARRRPWRHDYRSRAEPLWPVNPAVDRRRDAERMKPAPAVHHVSSGPVGEEGETERHVLGRPGGAG